MTKKRSGPPLKDEVLAIRVSSAQAAAVREAAAKLEIRVSDFVREAVLVKLAAQVTR